MIDIARLQERVDRGVAWLNGYRPRWFDEINLEVFSIESPCRCVIGQLFGHFGRRPEQLLLYPSKWGFDIPAICCDEPAKGWAALDELWIETIRALQESHKVTLTVAPTPAPADVMAIAK